MTCTRRRMTSRLFARTAQTNGGSPFRSFLWIRAPWRTILRASHSPPQPKPAHWSGSPTHLLPAVGEPDYPLTCSNKNWVIAKFPSLRRKCFESKVSTKMEKENDDHFLFPRQRREKWNGKRKPGRNVQRGSQVVICCRCIGSLRNILIFVNIFGKKHKSYLVKAVLELGHVALEHSGAHEVGEEDGLEVSHLVPICQILL